MKINSELRQHLMIGEVCNRFSYNGLIMQFFNKMKIVLLCFAVSFCYATRINAEVGHKVVNVKYDNGSSPSIAFISSGEYAGYIAEAHQASKLGSCALWFDIFDPYTEKRVVNVKYEDNASNPSIAFIPSGKYAGYIAEVHQTGNLWFDIFDPYTEKRVVNVKYEDNASDPSIAFISSGKYAGCIAEAHHDNANGLWFNILDQDGERVVNVKYEDNGSTPSIAFIPSGKYAGYIAEVHEFSEGQDDNLWFDILDQDGERVVNIKYEDKGLVPSIAFISSGEYAGYIAEAHQDQSDSKLWFDVLGQTGERIVNVEYDKGKLPSIAFISSGEYDSYIAEAHLTSGVTDDLWFDIVSTK